MRRAAIEHLADRGQICGHPFDNHYVCLLIPGHDGHHSHRWPTDPLTREQKLEREIAKLKAQRDSRSRRIVHLVNRIHALERRREWAEGYVAFRVEYRLRGGFRRLRRYGRIVWHRTVLRVIGKWPPA